MITLLCISGFVGVAAASVTTALLLGAALDFLLSPDNNYPRSQIPLDESSNAPIVFVCPVSHRMSV